MSLRYFLREEWINRPVTTQTSTMFQNEVKPLIDSANKVVIDFEKVEYISSSGLRVLLSLHKSITAKGGELIIRKPAETVMEVFDVTGFVDILDIEE